MERILYIVRHGIAVDRGTPGIADDDRPLTPEGEKKMRQAAKGLVALGVEVDRIVTSPLPRASRTAEIVAEALDKGMRPEIADALHARNDAAEIRDWLRTRPEARLMIVGHDPAFSDLVPLLTTGRDDSHWCEMAKGGVAALRGDPARDRWVLDWLARPKILRQTTG